MYTQGIRSLRLVSIGLIYLAIVFGGTSPRARAEAPPAEPSKQPPAFSKAAAQPAGPQVAIRETGLTPRQQPAHIDQDLHIYNGLHVNHTGIRPPALEVRLHYTAGLPPQASPDQAKAATAPTEYQTIYIREGSTYVLRLPERVSKLVISVPSRGDLGTSEVLLQPRIIPVSVSALTTQDDGATSATFTVQAAPQDGRTYGYYWDFGDGQSMFTHDPSVTHRYRRSGAFVPSVFVTDELGGQGNGSIAIQARIGTLAPLRVNHNALVNTNDMTVTLQGVAIPDLEYTARFRPGGIIAAIDRVTAPLTSEHGLASRVVRLPVYPVSQTLPISGWIANPERYFTNYLQPAVRHCVSRQIYCIIDWHWVSDYTSAEINTATVAFWTKVAQEYSGHPNVIFELFNEPMFPDNWATWHSVAQPWITLIRSYAPDNIIIAGAPHWSRHTRGAIAQPFTGGNIAYAAHIYAGHTKGLTPAQSEVKWRQWFGDTAAHYPVLLTEWGWQSCNRTYDPECDDSPEFYGSRTQFGTPFKNYIQSLPQSQRIAGWTAWVADFCLGPVMYDYPDTPETVTWSLLGNLATAEGEKYQGRFVQQWLRERYNDPFSSVTGTANSVAPFGTLEPDPICY